MRYGVARSGAVWCVQTGHGLVQHGRDRSGQLRHGLLKMENITEEQVLKWFETAELQDAIVINATAAGVIRMRQQQNGRKRRSDAGQKRKAEEPVLNFDPKDRP